MPHENQFETISILKISQDAILPTRVHPDDAGMDLYNLEDFLLEAGQGKVIRTGIAIALAHGFVGLVLDRSSLAKKGIKTAGGVIDAGYRGEIHIVLWNLSKETLHLKSGERIAQLLVVPIMTPAVVEVNTLNETSRGTKGFGSSGK